MEFIDTVKFHGHECPGLAMGYRMAKAGMEALKAIRSEDEEMVAIVENDACGVDALQCLTGCTFGKGNLIFRDHGKQVYTLYSRNTGEGIRISFHGKGIPEDLKNNMKARIEALLSAPEADLMTISQVKIDEPEPARIHASFLCDKCGERVMETRVRELDAKKLCMPCADEIL